VNPSTALAAVMMTQLRAASITDVVLSPGSRSTPLALQLAVAEREGELRLHVRIDERSAGFLAVGLARGSRRAVAVVCTSGTAVANLAPAVVEASYAGVPLVVITADRPTHLRNTGANQTIDQVGFFGSQVRHCVDIALGSEHGPPQASWGPTIARALAACRTSAGPVQINLGFADPLIPTEAIEAVAAVEIAPESGGWVKLAEPINYALGDLGRTEIPARGVVVVGDVLDAADSVAAVELAQACGWPIISEPSGNALSGPNAITGAQIVLANEQFFESHSPQIVVTVGRFGISRPTMKLVKSSDLHLAVDLGGRDRPDPLHTASAILSAVPLPPTADPLLAGLATDAQWLSDWRSAGEVAAGVIADRLSSTPFGGLTVTAVLLNALGPTDLLFVAASRSVRDVELLMKPSLTPAQPRIVGNRGASGIDGLTSTAWGIALTQPASSRTFALLGDLAFLHDHNGLLAAPGETQPNLTIVVVDNNGGGIFSGLEQGAPEFAADFERVFGTPHDLDLATIARATGLLVSEVAGAQELEAALAADQTGVHVIISKVADRETEQATRNGLFPNARGAKTEN